MYLQIIFIKEVRYNLPEHICYVTDKTNSLEEFWQMIAVKKIYYNI